MSSSSQPGGARGDDLFVGRKEALDKLHSLFKNNARLVTVTGQEGVGKTALVARFGVVHELTFTRDGSGVFFADLTEAKSEDEIISAVMDGLETEFSAPGRGNHRLALASLLETRGHALLILDHADRVLEETAKLTEFLRERAPKTQLLVTSRAPLGARGEVKLKLGPLRTPPKSVRDPDGAMRFESVELFVERAREVVPGWTLKPQDSSAVAEIARRLGGVPLGIRIAAARLRGFSPNELLERLPSRVELLESSRPTRAAPAKRSKLKRAGSPAQGRALSGTIDWSWRLLKPWEQAALRQASVFRGGFALASAEAVIDLGSGEQTPSVKNALQSLCEKSLLRAVETSVSAEPRFVHYGPVRDFAGDQLVKNGDLDRVRNRHAAHYLELGEELAQRVDEHGGVGRRRELEVESENLLAVVRSALSHEPLTVIDVERALRGLVALEPVLMTRGPFSVHLSLLDQALAVVEVLDVDDLLLARAYESRGRVRRVRGMFTHSLADFESALEAARSAGDPVWEARALGNIGTHHLATGDLEQAEALYGEALPLMREHELTQLEGRCTSFVGRLHEARGDAQSAFTCYEEAIATHRDVGDRRYEGVTLGALGALLTAYGKVRRGVLTLERALQIHREVGNRRYEGIVQTALARARFEHQRYDEASEMAEEALRLHREVLDRRAEGEARCLLGDIRLQQGALDDARTHYDLAATLQQSSGDERSAALTLAKCASVEATQGALEIAKETLRDAEEIADAIGDPELVEAVEIYRAHVRRLQPTPSHSWEDDESTVPEFARGKDPLTVPRGGARPETVRSAVKIVNALRAAG